MYVIGVNSLGRHVLLYVKMGKNVLRFWCLCWKVVELIIS